jgi:hypothetical protein
MAGTPWSVHKQMLEYRQGDWVEGALCAQIGDHDTFFPENHASPAEAKRICGMCEVAAECLSYALRAPYLIHGVWGGTTERQRRELRRARGIPQPPRGDRYEHGTEAGARAHYRRGDTRPCSSCLHAAQMARRRRG